MKMTLIKDKGNLFMQKLGIWFYGILEQSMEAMLDQGFLWKKKRITKI
jgi:hypothetical protein